MNHSELPARTAPDIREEMTISELLCEKEFRTALVAVEYNGRILKKDEYDSTVLKDGDVVEVVSFMGGG